MNNKNTKFLLVGFFSVFFFFSFFQTSQAGFFDWFKWFGWFKKTDSQKTVEIIPIVKKSESSSSQKNSSLNKTSNSSSKTSSFKSSANKTPATKSRITIKQSSGSAMLAQECSVKSYLAEKADYIVDGVVGSSESRWNEQKTSIFTYTNLVIQKYVKGMPFAENEIIIETPGGEVGGIGQSISDQPVFNQGGRVRVYFQNTSEGFSIVCAQAGVEEI